MCSCVLAELAWRSFLYDMMSWPGGSYSRVGLVALIPLLAFMFILIFIFIFICFKSDYRGRIPSVN